MNDDPVVVVEFALQINGRTLDDCTSKANDLGNRIMAEIGGEPWLMLDDDWKRIQPPERLTIADDQGFFYTGLRRYHFQGPLLGSVTTAEHHGYRSQGGLEE